MNTAAISFPLFGEGFIIDPPAYITIFGFNIYIYGLLITAGFALVAVYLLARRDVIGLSKDCLLDLIIIAVPCGLIGARIYYMVFNFEYYFGPGKWQNILQIREGGLAVYGGIILCGVAFLIYSRTKKIPIGKLLDAAGFGLFIGQSVGRCGNFFNREAFGIETDVPWKMGLIFDRNIYISSLDKTFTAGTPYYFHPTFLYEVLWNVVGLILMHIFSKKRRTKYPGQYFLFYVAWYGLGRFMIEGLRIDSLFIYGTDIRVSQLLAALSFLGAVLILIRNRLNGVLVLENTVGNEENAELKDEEENSEFGIRNSESGEDEENSEFEIQNSESKDEENSESGNAEEKEKIQNN